MNNYEIYELENLEAVVFRRLQRSFRFIEHFAVSITKEQTDFMQELLERKLPGDGRVNQTFAKQTIIAYYCARKLFHISHGTSLLEDLKKGKIGWFKNYRSDE